MTNMATDLAVNSGADHTKSLVIAWAVLVVLTLLSWWLREDMLGRNIAVAAIILVSFFKVYMVGHSFMELKFAPSWLRRCFEVWCIASCAVLVGMAVLL